MQAYRECSNSNLHAGERAGEALKEVDDSVVPWFKNAAKQLLEEYQDPEMVLARALAKITGHTELRVRILPSWLI